MIKEVKSFSFRLVPTHFDIHVFINISCLNDLRKQLKRHFFTEDFSNYFEDLNGVDQLDMVIPMTLPTSGTKTILLILSNPEPEIIIHECVHVMHELAKYSGIETGYKAQEWNAYFMEYLYTEIKKRLLL